MHRRPARHIGDPPRLGHARDIMLGSAPSVTRVPASRRMRSSRIRRSRRFRTGTSRRVLRRLANARSGTRRRPARPPPTRRDPTAAASPVTVDGSAADARACSGRLPVGVPPGIAAGTDGRVVVAWAEQTGAQAWTCSRQHRATPAPASARPCASGRRGLDRPVRPVDRDRARRPRRRRVLQTPRRAATWWPRRPRTIRPERSTRRPGRRASRSRAPPSHPSRTFGRFSDARRAPRRRRGAARGRSRVDARRLGGHAQPGPGHRRTRTCTRRCCCTSRRRPSGADAPAVSVPKNYTSPCPSPQPMPTPTRSTYSIAQQGAIGTASIPDPNVPTFMLLGAEGRGHRTRCRSGSTTACTSPR